MAKSALSNKKVISIVLMLIGVGLAGWGYEESVAVSAQVHSAVTGMHLDKVIALYSVGLISFVTGLLIYLKRS